MKALPSSMPKGARKRRPVDVIDTGEDALGLLEALQELECPVAVDTEFDKDKTARLMSLSWGKGHRYVVMGEQIHYFAPWLSSPGAKTVWSFFKADAKVFRQMGIDAEASFHADIVHTYWHVDEHALQHGLKEQSLALLGWKRKGYKELFSRVPPGKKKAITLQPGEVLGYLPAPAWLTVEELEKLRLDMLEYSGDDAESTILCYHEARAHLEQVGYWDTYLEVDRQFTLTLMRCEERGISLDLDRLTWIQGKASIMALRAEHRFRVGTGAPDVNFNSPKQMGKLLYEDLGWPKYDDLKTEGGDDSVNKQALDRWERDGYELATILKGWKTESKLVKDIVSLKEGMSPDGRIRSDLNQVGTDSGRISSRKWKEKRVVQQTLKSGRVKVVEKTFQLGANLQNIVGGGEKDQYGVRKAFCASKVGDPLPWGGFAEEDYMVICCDFAGFELCLETHWVATLGVKSKMLDVMREYKSPSAIHAFTAIQMFDIQLTMDEWKRVKKDYPDQYKTAKNLGFNLLYKGSPGMLAKLRRQDPNDPAVMEENQGLFDAWHALYPEVATCQAHMIAHGYEHGWVPTIARKASVPGLKSFDKGERAHWERKCTNVPNQGSAADIVKLAMNLIEGDEFLRERGCRQLLQVHDEIVAEAPASVAEECRERMETLMKEPYKDELEIDLAVEGKCADTWGAAK